MSEAVEAIFEHGVFRPLEPVALDEGQKVVLSVETVTPAGDRSVDLAAWREVFAGLSAEEVDEVERLALDRSQFIPRRAGKRK